MILLAIMKNTSLFINWVGDSAPARVLDYILTERELEFSKADCLRHIPVSRASLYKIWKRLIKIEMLLFSRNIGNVQLYKLNKANPVVKKLIEIDDLLIIQDLEKRAKKKTVHVVSLH